MTGIYLDMLYNLGTGGIKLRETDRVDCGRENDGGDCEEYIGRGRRKRLTKSGQATRYD